MSIQMEDEEIVDLKKCRCYPLKGQECYFNWIDEQFNEVSAKERYAKKMCPKKCDTRNDCDFCSFDGGWQSTVDPNLFLDNGDDDDDNAVANEGLLHYFVSWNGELVFLEAFIGEHEKAEHRLKYLICAIERDENKKVEYLDGYKYICKMLAAFIKFLKSSLHRSDVGSLQSFHDLSREAQIGVLSLKFVFFKEKQGTFKIQIPILRKLIELDPKNPVWYATLGLRLRLTKNESFSNGYRILPSSVEETNCFATAYSLRPDVPRFFAMLSRNIAEMLKFKRFRTDDEKVEVNVRDQRIKTVADAINFLRKYTRQLLQAAEVLPSKDDIARTLAKMGEVFSVSLPQKFHDYDLAEECIAKGIRISPTCSQANHRMGLFQWSKRHNSGKALEYLTAAVGSKHENYYAVIDWIELLLGQAVEKSDILTEIFQQLLSGSFPWTPDQTARFIFLKGCFLFLLKGKNKGTIDNWIRAYDMSSGFHFHMVFKEATRFGWKAFDKNC